MEKMLKRIFKLRLESSKFALLLCSLTLLTAISGCPEKPDFPSEVRVWETAKDPETGAYLCGEYAMSDATNIKFTPVIDHPLSQCEGVFGFKGSDFPKIIDHFKAVEDYYKKKLEACKQ